MRINQIFETTVFNDKTDVEGRFLVIPALAVGDLPSTQEAYHSFADDTLGFPEIDEIDHGRLVDAFASCIAADENSEFKAWLDNRASREPVEPERYQAHLEFAKYLAFSPVVPFRRNPLDLEAVASLVTSASGAGLGAYAGFVVGGVSPLILITVPAGMILFGTASGIAQGLEAGLRERIKRLLM